jgi:hypothetical protein
MAGSADNGSGRRGRLWRLAPWGIAVLILLLPLAAMPFTDEVAWDRVDFVLMGAMLFGACGAFELAARMTGNTAYRAAVGVAVVAAFILVWITLAVGIIGSEDNPANLMYGGVLAVGLLGALLVRFRMGIHGSELAGSHHGPDRFLRRPVASLRLAVSQGGTGGDVGGRGDVGWGALELVADRSSLGRARGGALGNSTRSAH